MIYEKSADYLNPLPTKNNLGAYIIMSLAGVMLGVLLVL